MLVAPHDLVCCTAWLYLQTKNIGCIK